MAKVLSLGRLCKRGHSLGAVYACIVPSLFMQVSIKSHEAAVDRVDTGVAQQPVRLVAKSAASLSDGAGLPVVGQHHREC
jgi:hypothetical protein